MDDTEMDIVLRAVDDASDTFKAVQSENIPDIFVTLVVTKGLRSNLVKAEQSENI